MKSIVQEASSIAKAIDNAWKRAEQPSEFSVRIHELPQKNMFGFTSKSAKIALFYEETKPKGRNNRSIQKPSRQKKAPEKPSAPVVKTKKAPARSRKNETGEPWNDEMVAYVQKWLNQLLQTLHIKHAKFNVEPQRYHLKITFTDPVFSQEDKNRTLFRNCAHLLLQSTRNNFKRPLKGFKVILTTES